VWWRSISTLVDLYATTERGIEDLVIEDLKKEFGIQAKFIGLRGKVFFKEDYEKIFWLNFSARSINRVILLLGLEEVETLQDIKRVVNSIDWGEFIFPEQSFAVRAERVGKHDFTSLDIAREVGATIIDNVKETRGMKPRVNLNSPDVIVSTELIHNRFIIGIDTTGLSLHIRRYRTYNHPMPLRTTLAYILVKVSQWQDTEILLDPTCGGGTIPIEAALYARKIPSVKFRKGEYALFRLKFFDTEEIEKVREKALNEMDLAKKLNLHGLDINPRHVKGALKNAMSAGVSDTIKFQVGDAEKLLDSFEEETVNVIVSNPPYKLPNKRRLSKLYHNLIKNALKVLTEGGRCAIITSEIGLTKRILEAMGIEFVMRKIFRYGSLDTGIFTFKK